MKNLRMFLPLVDGSQYPIEYANGKELIQDLISDDINPPPTALCFESTTDDGKILRLSIPFSDTDKASVEIVCDE